MLEAGLSIASITLGMLLGVFLLGVLTKRVQEKAAIAGVPSRAGWSFFTSNLYAHRVDLVRADRSQRYFRRRIFCIMVAAPHRSLTDEPSPRSHVELKRDLGLWGAVLHRDRHRNRQRNLSACRRP